MWSTGGLFRYKVSLGEERHSCSPSPTCQPRECLESPLQTQRWEPQHTRIHAWCFAWLQCLRRNCVWWSFWGTQTHKTSFCLNNQGLSPVPFRQAYPQIISEHVGRRSLRLSSLFASLSSQPGESDHSFPSCWSTPRSVSSEGANKQRGSGTEGKGKKKKELSVFTGSSFLVLPLSGALVSNATTAANQKAF